MTETELIEKLKSLGVNEVFYFHKCTNYEHFEKFFGKTNRRQLISFLHLYSGDSYKKISNWLDEESLVCSSSEVEYAKS